MHEYEDVIEILIEDIWHKPGPNDGVLREIRDLLDCYPASRGDTQERGVLKLLVDRLDPKAQPSGKKGCIVSWENCVFRLLYAVYGIDIIAFLFNHRRWAPRLTIESFQPQLFLERLSVLERAAKKLRHEEYIPVELPETKPYLKRGMGPKLNCFIEKDHRILLDFSLSELRAFGKLGVSMLPKYKNIPVEINMPMRINVARRTRTKKHNRTAANSNDQNAEKSSNSCQVANPAIRLEGPQKRRVKTGCADLLPKIWSGQNVASPGIRPREEKRNGEEPL